jgi:hypothetical protein
MTQVKTTLTFFLVLASIAALYQVLGIINQVLNFWVWTAL